MKLILICCVMLSISPMASSAHTADTSCGIIWDEPMLLSDTNYNAYSPKIALSGDDTVHIVWFAGGVRLPYRRSTTGGQNFEPTTELLTDSATFPFEANMPWIVAWRQNAYVFFQGGTPGLYSPVRMVKSSTGGSSWEYPVDISPDSTGPPPLTPTVLGDTIVMTYEPRGEPLPWILRSTDAGLTWEDVSSGVRILHGLALGPRVTLSAGGVLHLVQRSSTGAGETEYRRSHDLGDSWVQTEVISTVDQYFSYDVTIAADDTLLIAAWRDPKYGCLGTLGCSIIGRAGIVGMDSTSWSNERLLSDVPSGYRPAVAVSGGRFAAAWCIDQPTPPYAQVKTSQDTAWRSAFDPSAIPTISVTDVAVALSSNALHVVWEANQAPSPGTFRIFYRRGRFVTTDVREDHHQIPRLARLEQNYPNPFNPSTRIVYRVTSRESVSLRVFDVLGREVAMLVNETREPGEHAVEWNALTRSGQVLPSGVYYYRLIAGGRVETRKAVLIR